MSMYSIYIYMYIYYSCLSLPPSLLPPSLSFVLSLLSFPLTVLCPLSFFFISSHIHARTHTSRMGKGICERRVRGV